MRLLLGYVCLWLKMYLFNKQQLSITYSVWWFTFKHLWIQRGKKKQANDPNKLVLKTSALLRKNKEWNCHRWLSEQRGNAFSFEFNWMCLGVLPACMSLSTWVPACGGHSSDPLELEMETAVRCHVNVRNQTSLLWKNTYWSSLLSHLFGPAFFF